MFWGYKDVNLFLSKTFIIKELKKKAEITPSRGGQTYNEKDTPKVQKGIREWKEIRSDRTPEISKKESYWKSQSSCSAL